MKTIITIFTVIFTVIENCEFAPAFAQTPMVAVQKSDEAIQPQKIKKGKRGSRGTTVIINNDAGAGGTRAYCAHGGGDPIVPRFNLLNELPTSMEEYLIGNIGDSILLFSELVNKIAWDMENGDPSWQVSDTPVGTDSAQEAHTKTLLPHGLAMLRLEAEEVLQKAHDREVRQKMEQLSILYTYLQKEVHLLPQATAGKLGNIKQIYVEALNYVLKRYERALEKLEQLGLKVSKEE